MRPFTQTIIDLFDGKKRYLIPLYQRQYAWKIDPQLDMLWEDIVRTARQLEACGKLSAPHFMGAMVIAQIKTYGKEVTAYEVIDGQQRLTTFQLLLAAIRDEVADLSPAYAAEIQGYLFNDKVMQTPEIEQFKLWPSFSDRHAFVALMKAPIPVKHFIGGELSEAVLPAVGAHAYFREKVRSHIRPDGEFDEFRLEKLFEALKIGLAVVSIELEDGDDAQTIFETLNSRGVDLSAGDLMRNFIFQRAKGFGQTDGNLNVDELYQRYWLPLDAWFWKEGDTRGRLTRPRLDWLLVDHLSMKCGELVSVDDLYEKYRRWIISAKPFRSIEDELKSIEASAKVHMRLVGQNPDDPLGRFGRLAKAFDVSTAMPLVLLLATECDLGGELSIALAMVEDWIVRRDICGLKVASYNRFFIEAVNKIRRADSSALQALRSVLTASTAETARWPDNEEWAKAWLSRGQYKGNRQPRLRFILEELEQKKRSAANEIVAIKSDLTIEHILPQKWKENWPLPHAPEEADEWDEFLRAGERDQSVETIGNLTLLTQTLNSSVSNGPFSVKMPAVRAQASLTLNRELLAFDTWDEATIRERGMALFKTAAAVWPGPTANPGAALL